MSVTGEQSMFLQNLERQGQFREVRLASRWRPGRCHGHQAGISRAQLNPLKEAEAVEVPH